MDSVLQTCVQTKTRESPLPRAGKIKRPSKVPFIRANVLAAVVSELVRLGVEPDSLLRDHIEAINDIDNPYKEIPLKRYVAFFEAAAKMADDPLFGAHIGAHFRPEELGPLGVLFVAATSLQAALKRLGNLLQAWQSGTRVELEAGSSTAEWIYQIEDPRIQPRRQDAEFSLSVTCTFIRMLLGPGWAPIEVHLEHSELNPRKRASMKGLSAIFRAPVVFDQSVNRLVLDKKDLTRDVSRTRQDMVPYLEQHLRDLMSSGIRTDNISTQVSYLIAKRLGRLPTDIHSLANELGVSARTLQRRLADEDKSLRALVREHRLRIAEPLLNSGQTPITSIAHSVGYSDPTAFSRAFKDWRGRSPRRFRETETRPGSRKSKRPKRS